MPRRRKSWFVDRIPWSKMRIKPKYLKIHKRRITSAPLKLIIRHLKLKIRTSSNLPLMLMMKMKKQWRATKRRLKFPLIKKSPKKNSSTPMRRKKRKKKIKLLKKRRRNQLCKMKRLRMKLQRKSMTTIILLPLLKKNPSRTIQLTHMQLQINRWIKSAPSG